MIIYRPQRSELCESMSQAKEFETEQEMKEYIVKDWNGYFSVEDVVIEGKPSADDRTGWKDTRYVCTKKFGEQDNIEHYGVAQCIGLCATEYDKGGQTGTQERERILNSKPKFKLFTDKAIRDSVEKFFEEQRKKIEKVT